MLFSIQAFKRTLPAMIGSLGLVGLAQGQSTYVALGDSITFGETELQYFQSNGDRGYVNDFADILGTRTGTRPTVRNFAIDGETASSFTTAAGRVPPVTGRTDAILAGQNSNYTNMTSTPQATQFATAVSQAAAANRPVSTVSISLGFNDLAATLNSGQSITDALATYRTQYSAILGNIRTTLPSADIYILNYFNPFPANPGNPAGPTFATGGPQLNAIIASLATQYNARLVDTFTPFVGNEARFTNIDETPAGGTISGPFGGTTPIGNVHPNESLGYVAIANAAANAVPEPGSLAVMGLGTLLLARRRRA